MQNATPISSIRPLAPDHAERVLERLGLPRAPEPDLAGLDALYSAYCRRVPFDNVQKRVFLSRGGVGPMPGSVAEEFWTAWLTHGTGGTCWAGSGALGAMLASCGFTVYRTFATMAPGPHSKEPTHGTLVVDLDGERFLVDHSTTNGVALPLDGRARDGALGGARIVRSESGDTLLLWRPLHAPAEMPCRVDVIGVSDDAFRERHEATRGWGLFNPALYLRVARPEGIVGIFMGRRIVLRFDGTMTARQLDAEGRVRALVEDAGISEEMARSVPVDEPLPPPPGVPAERWAEMLAGMMASLPPVSD